MENSINDRLEQIELALTNEIQQRERLQIDVFQRYEISKMFLSVQEHTNRIRILERDIIFLGISMIILFLALIYAN